MGFVYKNITAQTQLIAVINDAGTDVSHVPVAAGARIEVTRPTLDVYLPHVLARINESGTDITHLILRQNADWNLVSEKVKNEVPVQTEQLSAPTPAEVPQVVVASEPAVESVVPVVKSNKKSAKA